MRRIFTAVLGLLALDGAALAADLAPPLPASGQAPPVWTGFYAGLDVGGAFGVSRNAFNIPGFEIPSFDTPLVGVLEANFGGSGLRGSRKAPCLPPVCGLLEASYTQKLSWFGTLRPRVGYALGNWLLYATGGGALGQLNTNATAATRPLD